MQHVPGYRLLQRLDGPPHGSCWYAVRDADARPALVIVNDVPYHDAIALDAARALAHEAQQLDPERLRTPRQIISLQDRLAIALDASRAELGQRDMLRLTQDLGLSLRRTPQEAARLVLALIRALAPLEHAPHSNHCDADRVLLSADGRVRFDPVRAPLITRANIVGRVSGPVMALDDLPPEVARAQPVDARTHVFFAGVALYRFAVGGSPRRPQANAFQRYTDLAENVFHPDTARLSTTAPGLAAIAARATARDPSARYPDLEALAVDVYQEAARHENTFPLPHAPDHATVEGLLAGLRESLNAGHLSAALAHLDRAPDALYHHPAVRDYVQQHAQQHRLEAVVDAVYATNRSAEPPLDWAALHLATQAPGVRARFFADSLGRNPSREPARARLSLWASGRHPVLPPPQASSPTLAAPTAPDLRAPPMLDAPPVPLGAMQLTRCAKRWDDLRDTDAGADVRFCDACDQRVTRVERIGDLIGLAGSCAYVTPAALNTLDVTDTLDMRPQSDGGGGVTGGVAPLPEEPGGMVGGLVELNEHGEPLPDLDPVLFTQEELEALGLPTGPPKKRSLVQRLRDWWSDDGG